MPEIKTEKHHRQIRENGTEYIEKKTKEKVTENEDILGGEEEKPTNDEATSGPYRGRHERRNESVALEILKLSSKKLYFVKIAGHRCPTEDYPNKTSGITAETKTKDYDSHSSGADFAVQKF